MAILEIYPKAGLGVGPFIENGFYQDYDLPESFSEDMLPKIQKRVKKLISQNIEFKQHAVSFKEALKLYKHDPYKTELIEELKKAGEKDVSFYKSDWFENLCKGPHVNSTADLKDVAFKLDKIAGAYWKGNEKNKMLQRIYGLAFTTQEELDDYLKMLKEAEKEGHLNFIAPMMERQMARILATKEEDESLPKNERYTKYIQLDMDLYERIGKACGNMASHMKMIKGELILEDDEEFV